MYYLKLAWKNFLHNRWYVSLMVLSLAIGIFCFAVGSMYVDFEYSRNSNHEDAERVYRVMLKVNQDGRNTYLPYALASNLKARHPEIEHLSLLDGVRDELYISINKNDFIAEDRGYFADPGFFQVFTFPLKYGSEKDALRGVDNIVISSELSFRLFGDQNPVGETVWIHERGNFRVSGVLQDIPAESLLYPGLIFTRERYFLDQPEKKDTWTNFTHVKLKPETSVEDFRNNLFASYQANYPDGKYVGVYAEKLTDAFWGYSYYDYGGGANYDSFLGADRSLINTVGYVAFGVMICAIIGYLSLSLGLSIERSKEIGIRKVNGARRSDVIWQLLVESTGYSLVALLIAVMALELTGGFFAELFGVPVNVDYANIALLLKGFTLAMTVGIVSGLYPALIISRLNPVDSIRRKRDSPTAGFDLRKILLVTQLVIAAILIFGSLAQLNQTQTMQNFDFGYDKSSLVAFKLERGQNIRENYAEILSDIQSLDGVIDTSGGPFPFSINGYSDLKYDNGDTLLNQQVARVLVTNNFFEMLDIEVLQGRSFVQSDVVNANNICIINDAMAKELGDNLVGATVDFAGVNRVIIGITQNYTDWGLSDPYADPRIYLLSTQNSFHSILIKHDGRNTGQLLNRLEGIWRNYQNVIEPGVVDLEAEEDWTIDRMRKSTILTGFLSSMVLVLSLFNLIGYVVMFSSRKVKSMSIRKVLGAQIPELFFRLLRPFIMSLVLGLSIALPIAYWLMNDYLNNYAVRVQLTFKDGLVVSGLLSIAILLSIGFQFLQVCRINPANVLKSE